MKFKCHHIAFIFLGLIYLLFPTQNANIDSWYYAACVKYGQELWNSHHLLYNVIGYFWYHFLKLFNPNIEAIACLNSMNAFAAIGCLYVLYACLLKLNSDKKTALWLALLSGVSFGFMRFATDAETYILPIFCSLIATYYCIVFSKIKHLYLSLFFLCLAILIHQLHIWWGIAIVLHFINMIFLNFKLNFIFKKKSQVNTPLQYKEVKAWYAIEKDEDNATQIGIKKHFILASFISIIFIFSLYYIGFHFSKAITFWQFISGEYGKGNAAINIRNGLLLIVNFFRTFLQLHGYILELIKNYWIILIILLIDILFVLYYLIRYRKILFNFVKTYSLSFNLIFILAFSLHLLFAFLSSGNAEFMVMLPFLLVLFLAGNYQLNNLLSIKFIVISLFVWNFSFGVLTYHFININKVDKQVEVTLQNPNAYFLWYNKPLVENKITYLNGFNLKYKFINLKEKNSSKFLDSLIETDAIIYSDFGNPTTNFKREKFSRNNENNFEGAIGGRYYFKSVSTFENIYGENHIYLISKKGD